MHKNDINYQGIIAMKNIKKMALYATIIVATTYHYQVYSMPAGLAAVSKLDEAMTKHMPAVLNAAENVGIKAATTLADGLQHIDPTLANQAAGTLGDKLKEAAPKVALEAAEKFAPALENISTAAVVGVAMYGTYQVASTANDVYNYFNPDEEKKARIEKATEEVEYYKAKRGLRSCFMSNAKTPRDNEGLPIACQNFSDTYRTLAGKAALDEMVTNFKDTHAYKSY